MSCCGLQNDDAYVAIKMLLESVSAVSALVLTADQKTDSQERVDNLDSLIEGLGELALLMAQGKLKKNEKNQVKQLVKLHNTAVNDRIRPHVQALHQNTQVKI